MHTRKRSRVLALRDTACCQDSSPSTAPPVKKRSRSSVIGTSKETQTGSNEPTAIIAHTSQGHSSGKQAVRRGAKHSSSKTSKSKSGKTLTSVPANLWRFFRPDLSK